jgi:hypothetical protein
LRERPSPGRKAPARCGSSTAMSRSPGWTSIPRTASASLPCSHQRRAKHSLPSRAQVAQQVDVRPVRRPVTTDAGCHLSDTAVRHPTGRGRQQLAVLADTDALKPPSGAEPRRQRCAPDVEPNRDPVAMPPDRGAHRNGPRWRDAQGPPPGRPRWSSPPGGCLRQARSPGQPGSLAPWSSGSGATSHHPEGRHGGLLGWPLAIPPETTKARASRGFTSSDLGFRSRGPGRI